MDTDRTHPTHEIPRQLSHPGIILLICLVALILLVAAWYFWMAVPATTGPAEPLVISSGSPEFSTLTIIADKMGFFRKNGLNVTIKDYPTGVLAVDDMLAGNADLAYAAEFVGVGSSFRAPELRILATTAKSDVIALVIRGDRGIRKPSDLAGKTVAVPKGTAAEFFLGRYLMLNGMDIRDVRVLYLGPADLVNAVVNGSADAASIWEPYVYTIEQQLGLGGTTWPAQAGQYFYWTAYTRDDVIRDRPDVIRRYLRALGDAEVWLDAHEPEGRAIMQKHLNVSDAYMDRIWGKSRFGVSLDQGLVLAFEDEARWMVAENMTGGMKPPSSIAIIYKDALREVRPPAVTIIG